MRGIVQMKDSQAFGAVQHRGDNADENEQGETWADLRHGDGAGAQQGADGIHQKHRLPLGKTETEEPMMEMALIGLHDGNPGQFPAHDGKGRIQNGQP